MTTPAEREHIERNLPVIRAYLKRKFPGYDLIDVADLGSHKFAVMNEDLGKHHKLRVRWIKLSPGSTPTMIEAELERDDVAARMVQATDYFIW